jgi:hypothetical protein
LIKYFFSETSQRYIFALLILFYLKKQDIWLNFGDNLCLFK